jgi:hypothetical protein
MPINQAFADILDETVAALSDLNLEALRALEQRTVMLAESAETFERDAVSVVLAKKRLLEIVLQNCRVNLDALTRLHARNMRNQWAQ